MPLPSLALAWPLGAPVKAWCSATRWPGLPGVPSLWVCDQPYGHDGDHTDREERARWPRERPAAVAELHSPRRPLATDIDHGSASR